MDGTPGEGGSDLQHIVLVRRSWVSEKGVTKAMAFSPLHNLPHTVHNACCNSGALAYIGLTFVSYV